MTEEHVFYLKIGQGLNGAEESQMFGKPCFKIQGKAFMSFFQNELVVKLTGDSHQQALSLDGTKGFDPSGKNRPMREWIQIPYQYRAQWEYFALSAMEYVNGNM